MKRTLGVVVDVASIGPDGGLEALAGDGLGPVDHEGVHVVEAEVAEGGLQVLTHVGGTVVGVPQLALEHVTC